MDMKAPTDEEIVSLLTQQLMPQMAVVHAFAPHIDGKIFPKVAQQCAKQQLDIDKNIMPTFLDPETLDKHPLILITVWTEDEDGNKKEATFPAYKRLEDVKGDPQLAVASAVALAFLMNPLPRAILMLHGFKFKFVQTNAPGRLTLVQ